MEFLLHGLAEFSILGKAKLESGTQFQDLLTGIMGGKLDGDEIEMDQW